ncbi:thiamine ABC transporter ATP-binding protein [Consotaella salsifontis]|uniref:Thiamine transport system ATP-binding protein n=1 Tax=Consotaella salsifontis TaxID=1365950 RepID=A0A1T4QSD2_9HYPH|nr:thiamine ABC transporter ATP-binding protein [Consotaella salsifontis]SKA06689.1 thiamine transport system ATP-binding protein [Consotaella salsifontis]
MTSTGGNETTALRLEGVDYAYEGMTMHFDLAVTAGEWLAVIGPSGAGKSTLLDLVAGFLAPDAGRIVIDGADMAGIAPAERPVSFVFQENNLFAHLTAAENVGLGLAPRLSLSRETRARASQALAEVGLAGFDDRRPAEMSGGERQRVALARAFVRDRPLILLDEPFAALGPALRREMLALLDERRRRAERPITILMVTHQPEDARGFADCVAFLERGRIATLGPTESVLDGNETPGVADYLGQATRPS